MTTNTHIAPRERIRRFCLGQEPQTEYELQRLVSDYLNLHYKKVEYRVDIAGSNLSKAQAGKIKHVNKRKGWHDLEIYDPSGDYTGLCIELKVHGTRLTLKNDAKRKKILEYKKHRGKVFPIMENRRRKAGEWKDAHIEHQAKNAEKMRERGRAAGFGVGLEKTLMIIEGYFEGDVELMEEGFKVE